MDRRRSEEAFQLFGAIEVIRKYGLPITKIPYNKNELAELVSKCYHDAFLKQWGGNNNFFKPP